MNISLQYVYAIAEIPFISVRIIFFLKRKDLRKEILTMSFLLGFANIFTSHFWWKDDWWRPLTITGTRVGVEDFILGFAPGGIMATAYEFSFKKSLYKKVKTFNHLGLLTLVLLTALTESILWHFGTTSFYASTIAMTTVGVVIVLIRKDLFVNAFFSAILMTLMSVPFYIMVFAIAPEWIDKTYLPSLSGIRLVGVPIEEFVFWFLSGFLFGPFYEYWKGELLRKVR